MANIFNQFKNDDELIENLGTAIAEQLKQGILEKGTATLAVSGGSSPRPLFQFLSKQNLSWKAVSITLIDERWLEADNKDANANLVKSLLLQNKAADAHFIPLYNGADSPYEAEKDIDRRLGTILSSPIDVAVLGMGEDGHTASFFPNADTLKNALFTKGKKCCAITPPQAPYDRMTLTLPTILNSRRLFLHLTGSKKRQVLEQALKTSVDPNNLENAFELINQLPIRTVLHQNQPPLEIYYRD